VSLAVLASRGSHLGREFHLEDLGGSRREKNKGKISEDEVTMSNVD